MALIVKRQAARRDLKHQWLWYAENASVEVVDRFLAATDKALALLSTQREIGVQFFATKGKLKGIRRFRLADGFEKIILFYFPLPDGIDLVRVIHGNRELEQVLGGE